MIHQLIFAAPKPGMSETEFQRYWLEVHAPRYAAKIPQIRKYMVDTTIPFPETGEPVWKGVAEIWLANEEEQLASLRSEEFLQGARLDEPRWAAFWQTIALDTDAHELGTRELGAGAPGGIKMITLLKRREGMTVPEFREHGLGKHAELMLQVPGLRRYLQGHTRDGAYGVGEAVLDAAEQTWFDDEDALRAALGSPEYRRAEEDLRSFTVSRYVHRLVVREHWVIGPESR